MNYYLDVLKKYAVFEGRARRQEYWMFVLINIIIMGLLGAAERMLGSSGILANLYSLAILVPVLAVSVRRLHDTGRSGWLLLIGLIPVVGSIVLLVFMVLDGEADANAFGPAPKRNAEYIEI